jgi:SAM-dependent methyltransferase
VLQLARLNRRVVASLPREALQWRSAADLERVADLAVARVRRGRLEGAASTWERLGRRLDRRVATDAVEYLDRPDHPASRKLRQVRWLHLQNLALRIYPRFFGLLSPSLQSSLRARRGDRVRLLELASGSGEMTLAVARLVAERGLPVDVTGSDIIETCVRDAERRARAGGSLARFRVLNAFDLASALRPGDVDVAFIVQSIHHFSPGQLAMMIAQVGAAGGRHLVAIDGRRSLAALGLVPALGAFTLDPWFTHDALVSARRFYGEVELELIARIAAPTARVSVRRDGPLLSVLTVAFPPSEAAA